MQDYKNLEVWKKAHQLTLEAYRMTLRYPAPEVYGLTSQTRRAAASIPANIAEGCGRNSDGELRRFLNIALGSASELDYHALLARDLTYIDAAAYLEISNMIDEVRRMATGLLKRLK